MGGRWARRLAERMDANEKRRERFELAYVLLPFLCGATLGLILGKLPSVLVWAVPIIAGLGSAFLYYVKLPLGQVSAARGTFYYVRWLPSFVSDWYLDEVTKHDGNSPVRPLDRKIIASAPAYQAGETHYDAAAELDDLYARLELAINSDDQTTAFRLTPNLLWPGGLRLGSDLTARLDLRLEEVERAETVGAESEDAPGLEDARLTWSPSGPGPARVPPSLEAREESKAVPMKVTSILVLVDFSRQGPCTPPEGRTFDRVVRIGLWKRRGEGWVTAKVRHRIPNKPTVAGKNPSEREDPGVELVSPDDATEVFVQTLRQELHVYPEATIYLVARVPKSVGVAMGHRLMSTADTSRKSPSGPGCGESGCRQESCKNPWSRIVGLSWTGQDYAITRVHRSQPPLHDMITKWDLLGTGT